MVYDGVNKHLNLIHSQAKPGLEISMSTDTLRTRQYDKRILCIDSDCSGIGWRGKAFKFITSGLCLFASTVIELAWPRLIKDRPRAIWVLIITDALLVSSYHQLMNELGLIVYNDVVDRLIKKHFTLLYNVTNDDDDDDDKELSMENLIVKDANTVRLYCSCVHYWWSLLVQVLWCAWQIMNGFGYKRGLMGLLVMIAMFAMSILLSRWLKRSRHHQQSVNDERTMLCYLMVHIMVVPNLKWPFPASSP